jgi:triacylglycerol lipase
MGDLTFLAKARQLAEAAAAAYLSRQRPIAERLGASGVAVFAHAATFGFVAELGDEVVVAFRGTAPGEVLNWLTNLDFAQAPFPPGLTHRGVTRALAAVWGQVEEHALPLLAPGRTVWFTGHSLGGALATLAAARFASAWDDVRVCTFGAPRVGCPDFAAGYRPRLHRIEHAEDLVCHLPPPPGLLEPLLLALGATLPAPLAWLLPAGARYRHVGDLVLIDPDDSVAFAADDGESLASLERRLLPLLAGALSPARLLQGHRIDSYLTRLTAAAAGQPAAGQTSSPISPLPQRFSTMPGAAHIDIDVSVLNQTDRKLIRLEAVKNWGIYAVAPPGVIEPGGEAEFRIESNGIMTGADGSATYQLEGVNGAVKLMFQAPFWHGNHFEGSAPPGFVVDHAGSLGGKHPSVRFTVKPA